MNRKIVYILIIISLLTTAVFAQQEEFRVRSGTPEYACRKFFRALGNENFLTCYNMLARHAKRALIRRAIERFSYLDNRHYLLEEMDYYLKTNIEGHRTVFFEDLVKEMCQQMGIKKEDLKAVTVSPPKMEKSDRAVVEYEIGGKKDTMVMKMQAGEWKAAWYPEEKTEDKSETGD